MDHTSNFLLEGGGGGPISLLTFYCKEVGGVGSHFQLFTLRGRGRTDITSNFLLQGGGGGVVRTSNF